LLNQLGGRQKLASWLSFCQVAVTTAFISSLLLRDRRAFLGVFVCKAHDDAARSRHSNSPTDEQVMNRAELLSRRPIHLFLGGTLLVFASLGLSGCGSKETTVVEPETYELTEQEQANRERAEKMNAERTQ
jgi:hypothetical protein